MAFKLMQTFLTTIALALSLATSALAGPPEVNVIPAPSPSPAPSSPWEVQVGTPLWLSGVRGEVGVADRTVSVDTTFDDILPHLDFVAALDLEVRYKRWLLLMDGLYLDASVSAEPNGLVGRVFDKVTLHLSQGLWEGALGCTRSP
jgi:hypothetical protein